MGSYRTKCPGCRGRGDGTCFDCGGIGWIRRKVTPMEELAKNLSCTCFKGPFGSSPTCPVHAPLTVGDKFRIAKEAIGRR